MSLTLKQISQEELDFILLTVTIVCVTSFAITPVLLAEFTNDQGISDYVPVFEEVGDIFDPTHWFQEEKRSEEWKNTRNKAIEVAGKGEAITEPIARIPQAGDPTNLDNPNNDPKTQVPDNPDSNIIATSESQFYIANPVFDPTPKKQADWNPETKTDFGRSEQHDLKDCSQRGAEVDLRNCDLSGMDLYGAVFNKADLSGADLSGANLQYALFNGADLSGANLNGANLVGSGLIDTNLEGATIDGADLRGARLDKFMCMWGVNKDVSVPFDINGDNINDVELRAVQYFSFLCMLIVK